ncbi:MAG: OsmC family protein [Rhodospirillales bacterium]|nr:OsmC family protein [Rhodospirillales bacterium]
MPTRRSEAEWNGGLKDGHGRMRFGGYSFPYFFASRFEAGNGTNPEELLGAAHAGCFSMALSVLLEKNGVKPQKVYTKADVHLELVEGGYAITRIDLTTEVHAAGIDEETFHRYANETKAGCPVSRALSGTEVTLRAKLSR